ncbi:MAG TPA: nuclear transport factor 2 family protein [Gemmatimonadaceae bacterium]|nr:nuclear transport factor 2 family protein [Gemmatimonadaceae bacterium]
MTVRSSSPRPRHLRSATGRLGAALLLAFVVAALPARDAAAQQSRAVAVADTVPAKSGAGTGTSAAGKRRAKKKAAAAAPLHLTAKQKLAREMDAAERQVRAALVIQDTATLSHWWADEYTYTAPSGETFSKDERLESIMSPGFVGEDAVEVLPSELDIVRRYGDVVIVNSRLGPPSAAAGSSATARSRAGRTQLLTVWVRQNGRWRTVASQATAVTPPAPPPVPSKKKR